MSRTAAIALLAVTAACATTTSHPASRPVPRIPPQKPAPPETIAGASEPKKPPAPEKIDKPVRLPAPPPAPEPPIVHAPPGKSLFIWPVDGVVVSAFGNREGGKHEGIDIAAPIGTPIWASAAGKVIFAGEQPAYGKLVIVEHAGNWVTIYAHNQSNLVGEGAEVAQGDPIARVGQSGEATTPAVHFELRSGREVVNPMPKLPD